MKLVKSLLLGSAAGLATAAGAQAADLPTKKAAPVEYVRICAVHGPGFFYIPGSDTCIRLSGRTRFEFVGTQVYNKATDPSSFFALGRLAIDARTQTDWGLLRAYTRVDFNRRSGNNYFGSGTSARAGFAFGFGGAAGAFPAFSGVDTVGNRLQTGIGISAAFVQWGGLTAGRIQSFFDFYADNDTWFGTEDSDILTQTLAYTYTFGSGFSATLSIEDPKERQRDPIAGIAPVGVGGINPTAATPTFTAIYPFVGSPFFPTSVVVGGVPTPGITAGGINYTQREDVPDVVGVLRVDQGWGSAQVSGLYHRIATSGSTVVNLTPTLTGGFVQNPVVPTVPGGYGAVDGNGWAVQGGVKINLPMIAAGDTLYLQAAYSKGNISAVDSGFPSQYQGQAFNSQGTSFETYDAVVGPSGHVTLTPAYSGLVALTHYWTPTLRSSLVVGAVHVNYSGSIRTAAGFAQGVACPTCIGSVAIGGSTYNPFNPNYNGGTEYTAAGNIIWSPVKDLDIGVEVVYYRVQMQHSEFDINQGVGKIVSSGQGWDYRLRVSRDF